MALLGLDSLFAQTLFWTYVSLWVSCHLLIFQSRQPNSPAFNATSVVLLTEALKLLIALTLVLWNEGGFASLVRAVQGNRMLLVKYALPALLYCVYNNLVYVNLEVFDPGTYNVLLQLRIVLTGLLYQLLFSKQLNRHQWRAIILISVGCVVKESAKLSHGTDVMQADLRSWALLLAQMLCSVFAGVYNEMLLKGTGSGAVPVSTNLQNAYMYLNSVLWNGLFLLQQGKLNEALAPQNLSTVFTPSILAIMAIMSSVNEEACTRSRGLSS
uniref:Uncharacterized protein n=1 Tax=Chrysotila carterae TaxID=13221 RepID=A0A6S9UKE5_CHRCT